MKYLKQTDFDKIGIVARHCDLRKLAIAEMEAFDFDLQAMLCDYFFEVEENWESDDEEWDKILNGTDWEGCNGKKRRHRGLKTLLAYIAYSRYVVLGQFDDTAGGIASKTADFTMLKPLSEVKDFSNKYRGMATKVWEDVRDYLCFIGWKLKGCGGCKCGGGCKSNSNTRLFGANPSNVNKYGVQ